MTNNKKVGARSFENHNDGIGLMTEFEDYVQHLGMIKFSLFFVYRSKGE
jgi:hypothetical protein